MTFKRHFKTGNISGPNSTENAAYKHMTRLHLTTLTQTDELLSFPDAAFELKEFSKLLAATCAFNSYTSCSVLETMRGIESL